MSRLSHFAMASAGGLALLTLSAALAQQKDVPKKQTAEQKKIGEQVAGYIYPGAKNLEERNDASSIYQGLLSTTDDLSRVAEWYDKKLFPGLPTGVIAGVTIGGDFSRTAVFQDGQRLNLEALAKRPVSTRSYLIRAKSHTLEVILSRPRGERLTVISLCYISE